MRRSRACIQITKIAFLFIALLAMGGAQSPAQAACLLNGAIASNTGTANADTLQCDDANPPNDGVVSGLGGGDTITLSGAAANAQSIRGGSGVDDIQISGGSTTGDVFLGDTNVASTSDADTFTITGGTVGRDVRGDAGADTFNLDGGTITRDVRGNTGADIITLDGATVSRNLRGDGGNDTINLLSGTANQVLGDAGADTINLGASPGSGTATVNTNIRGGGGGDTINLYGGTANQVRGDGGVDRITLDGATITTNIRGNGGNDIIDLLSGSANQVRGDTGADTITLDGATINGNIRGVNGDDTIDLLSGSANQVLGDNNNDTITLGSAPGTGSAAINTNIRGGNGDDTIDLLGGSANQVLGDNNNDTITLNGATVNTNIRGGNNNDVIDLLSGSVANVRGDAGSDVITLDGVTGVTSILGDAGVDRIDLLSGDVNLVNGGTENDEITLNGATVTTDILGADGDDTFDWLAGTMAGFDGGDGSDIATVSAASYDGSQILDGGDDAATGDGFIDELTLQNLSLTIDGGNIINWEIVGLADSTLSINDLVTPQLNVCGGSTVLGGASMVDDVDGCIQNDEIEITGTSVIANDVDGAGGSDTITISGDASVTGAVNGGGDGQDASSAADAGDVITIDTSGSVGSIDAGLGQDMVDLLSGTVGSVAGGGAADTITLNGATVMTDILGDAGADAINLLSGTTNLVSGGAEDDAITLNGATVTTNILGDAGDDTFDWLAGTMAGFDGGDGSDIATVSAASYDGSQILDGGDDTSIGDGFIDSLTFSGVTLAATGGNILNWESVTIDGGRFSFTDRMLTVGSGAGAGLFLRNGAILDAIGGFSLTGDLTNDAVVSTRDGIVGDVVAVSGDYGGSGSIELDVDFANDAADRLEVAGDVTSGTSSLSVNDVSTGVATGNDVVLVDVAGATQDGDFALAGGETITSGAVIYELELDGSQWVLTEATFAPEAVQYSAIDAIFLNAAKPSTFAQRSGFRAEAFRSSETAESQPRVYTQNASTFADRPEDRTGPWIRVFGDRLEEDLSGDANVGFESTVGRFQVGGDMALTEGEFGQVIVGLNGSLNLLDASTEGDAGGGSIDGSGFSAGVTATWYSPDGAAYLDTQAELGWLYSDIQSSTGGRLASNLESNTYMLSAEVGRRVSLGGGSSVVPQAQFWVAGVDTNTFTDSSGNVVDLGSDQDAVGRLGLAYEYSELEATSPGRRNFYVSGSVLNNFDGDSSATVSGRDITVSGEDAWAEVAAGGLVTVGEATHLFAEGAYRTAFDGAFSDNFGLSLSAGVRVQW